MFFFATADPLRLCRSSRVQPPSISFWWVLVERWSRSGRPLGQTCLTGRLARGGQTRCRQRHDSPDRPLRLPTAFLHARVWVTISQNSDLDCCLLLPSDPPSQPLPPLFATQNTAGTASRYLPRQAWGSHGRKSTHVPFPYRITHRHQRSDPPGPRNTRSIHFALARLGSDNRGPPHIRPIHPPKPAGPVGMFVHLDQVRTLCTLSPSPPRLPHPCPCLVIVCPALPACVLPSLGHAQPACG